MQKPQKTLTPDGKNVFKKCSVCGEAKPTTEFFVSTRAKDGLQSSCKDCNKEYKRKDRARRPEYFRQLDRERYQTEARQKWKKDYYEKTKDKQLENSRASRFRREYGLTIADYEKLVRAQSGCCAICLEPPTYGRGKRLYVDHDHETGEVRGLLCHHCNLVLGHARDRIDLLQEAISYLGGK